MRLGSVLLTTMAVLLLVAPALFAADADRDGVADSIDNCPNYWNPEQYDADEDGIGNVCDECTDQDGDGYGDPGFPTNTCLEDNCPGFANPDQADSDGDGIGDPCEGLECGDLNADGSVDSHDFFRAIGYMWRGEASPASMDIANTAGCGGVNLYDIVYTHYGPYSWYNCDGPSSCLPLPGTAISLDHVDGLYAPDTLTSGQAISLYIRLTGHETEYIDGLAFGFRVYSDSDVDWGRTDATCLVNFSELGPEVFFNVYSQRRYGMTGSGADTVSFGYFVFVPAERGLPPGYDSVTYEIRLGPIPHEYSGGEICLDSCWYPPTGDWMWGTAGGDGPDRDFFIPSWDGPHCFTIYNCCQIRGDIDNNGSGPDIADLIYMVTYMFQEGPEPPCMTAVDINGDELPEPDIADLIYLVTFMFQDGPPPAVCP